VNLIPEAVMLPGHEGGAAGRLPDGSLASGPDLPAAPVAYRAACSCGWQGAADHQADEFGTMSATSEWIQHMKPLWATAPPEWLMARSQSLREAVADLTQSWPLQALSVLRDVDQWHRSLTERAVAAARTTGSSWAEIATVLGVTRQSAHERFGRTDRNMQT
jgi:hypothetical protein